VEKKVGGGGGGIFNKKFKSFFFSFIKFKFAKLQSIGEKKTETEHCSKNV